jgi:hypothetical protein
MLDERHRERKGCEPARRPLAERLHPAAKREERLTAIAELYANGALSQAEYELERNEILDEI